MLWDFLQSLNLFLVHALYLQKVLDLEKERIVESIFAALLDSNLEFLTNKFLAR